MLLFHLQVLKFKICKTRRGEIDGQIMASDVAMGIIVIHEDLKKIIGSRSLCILRPNSKGEMIDRRRRLVYEEGL